MIQRVSLLRTAAVALLLSPLAACGDSSGPAKNNSHDDVDSSVDMDSTSDAASDDDDDGSANTPDAGDAAPDAAGDGDGDGDGEGPAPVRTATLTLGERTFTLTPRVARGLIATPGATHHRQTTDSATRSIVLACGPDALQTEGGRAIKVSTDYPQVYGAAYICQGGGLVDAQNALRSAARNCNGRSACSFDAVSAYHGGLWGCQGTGPTSISVDYACEAMPGVSPAMRLELDGEIKVGISALDGAGSASCTQRGANITLPEGYSLNEDAECVIDITTRTASTLAGTVSVSVVREDDEQSQPLSITFHHEKNTLTPSLWQSTSTHACHSAAVSHSTVVQSAHTADIIRAQAPYSCQPTEPSAPEAPTAVEVEVRRKTPEDPDPKASFSCGEGGRLSIRIGGRSTDRGSCVAISFGEDPYALRAMIHTIYLCDDQGEDCVAHDAMLLLSYDFSNPTK